jgi:prepilin-type N-terminal cleavage/methylation domain-containing protein
MATPLRNAQNNLRGFTLVELLVVVVILAILSGLSLTGLARAGKKGNAETSKFMISKLSNVILDHYETYEDLRLTLPSLADVRLRMREELPDSWTDVANDPSAIWLTGTSHITPGPTTAIGRAYMRYKATQPAPSPGYASAECLYMIISQSGLFPDFMKTVKSDRVGDIDNDGKREFWDGWGRPIAFCRWPAGFSAPYSPIQVNDPINYHDPVDVESGPLLTVSDTTAFAMIPLIFSPGPDEALNAPNASNSSGYGIVLSGTSGWPTGVVTGTVFGSSPTTYSFSDGLAGAIDPANATAYRDNITNHQLLAD